MSERLDKLEAEAKKILDACQNEAAVSFDVEYSAYHIKLSMDFYDFDSFKEVFLKIADNMRPTDDLSSYRKSTDSNILDLKTRINRVERRLGIAQ